MYHKIKTFWHKNYVFRASKLGEICEPNPFFRKVGHIPQLGKWSELRKSERRKPKRTPKTMQTITTSKRRSERRKANFQNVEKRIITTSKRVDHYYEYHNVEKNVESLKMTFDVLIFLDAKGNIRTSKVLVHFLAKKLSTFWFYLWRQKRSERRKSKRSTTYGVLPLCTKACGGLG